MPTPAVRVNPFDKDGVDVFMDHDAIADELNRFKDKHQDCPEPVKTPTTEAEGPVN
jgi:hypothetical protein